MRAKRACCNASEARIFAPVGGIASETEYKTVGKTEGKTEGKAGQGRTKQRQGRGRVETTCERNRSMNNSLRFASMLAKRSEAKRSEASVLSHASKASMLQCERSAHFLTGRRYCKRHRVQDSGQDRGQGRGYGRAG